MKYMKQGGGYVKSHTVQPIPDLISYAEVTRRWEMLFHARKAARWLGLFIHA